MNVPNYIPELAHPEPVRRPGHPLQPIQITVTQTQFSESTFNASATFTLNPALSAVPVPSSGNTSVLPAATLNQPYTTTVFTGGTGPYTWALPVHLLVPCLPDLRCLPAPLQPVSRGAPPHKPDCTSSVCRSPTSGATSSIRIMLWRLWYARSQFGGPLVHTRWEVTRSHHRDRYRLRSPTTGLNPTTRARKL